MSVLEILTTVVAAALPLAGGVVLILARRSYENQRALYKTQLELLRRTLTAREAEHVVKAAHELRDVDEKHWKEVLELLRASRRAHDDTNESQETASAP